MGGAERWASPQCCLTQVVPHLPFPDLPRMFYAAAVRWEDSGFAWLLLQASRRVNFVREEPSLDQRPIPRRFACAQSHSKVTPDFGVPSCHASYFHLHSAHTPALEQRGLAARSYGAGNGRPGLARTFSVQALNIFCPNRSHGRGFGSASVDGLLFHRTNDGVAHRLPACRPSVKNGWCRPSLQLPSRENWGRS